MTGMVRKVDELGRIVIPKEMRRVLGIRTGSSVEILVREDSVILRKFSELNNILSSAQTLMGEIYELTGQPTLVGDEDKIISCLGVKSREYIGKSFSLPEDKTRGKAKYIFSLDDIDGVVDYFPLTIDGFNSGYVFVLSREGLDKDKHMAVSTLCHFFSRIIR